MLDKTRLKRVPSVTIGSAYATNSLVHAIRLLASAGDQIHAWFKCSAPRQTRRIETPKQMLRVDSPLNFQCATSNSSAFRLG
jgi:hypothetical protein